MAFSAGMIVFGCNGGPSKDSIPVSLIEWRQDSAECRGSFTLDTALRRLADLALVAVDTHGEQDVGVLMVDAPARGDTLRFVLYQMRCAEVVRWRVRDQGATDERRH